MKRNLVRFLLPAAVLVLGGCACLRSSALEAVNHSDPEYGYTKEKAIEVCKPRGQRDYLGSLACSDGLAPTFERTGNVGSRNALDIPEDKVLTPQEERELEARLVDENRILAPGELDIHITDRYEVDCRDTKVFLFLDMYHCQQPEPEFAPAGFGMMR